MLISHRDKWVYIGPPKTGSTTCHHWLRQEPLFDPSTDVDTTRQKKGSKHSHIIPFECRNYFTCVSWKDPEERLRSLWIWKSFKQIQKGEKPFSFQKFLEERSFLSGICKDQEFWHPPKVDYLIRCHMLEADLLNLPFVQGKQHLLGPVPHLKSTQEKYKPLIQRLRGERCDNCTQSGSVERCLDCIASALNLG